MRPLVGFVFVLALVASPLGFLGCGDEAAMLAPELFGTWEEVSTEMNGESWDCLTDCTRFAFNADGTYVIAMITPPLRGEGIWSTQGEMLTLTRLRAGPDVNSLEPLDPPRITTFRWSVSGDTLAMSVPGTTFFWRKESADEDAEPAGLRGL